MLYWFFVKGFGFIARLRINPIAQGVNNIPKKGGAIIAANHLLRHICAAHGGAKHQGNL